MSNIVSKLIVHEWDDFKGNLPLWVMVGLPIFLSFLIVKASVNEFVSMVDLVPSWVLFAQVMSGIMLMTLSFLDEKEKGTLEALLITPATYRQVVFTKVLFMTFLSTLAQFLVLLINGAFIGNVALFLVLLPVGGLISIMIGFLISMFTETVRNGSAVGSAVMVILFLSGAVFEAFGSLKDIVQYLPSVLSMHLVKDVLENNPLNTTNLLILIGWLVLLVVVSEVKIRMELQK